MIQTRPSARLLLLLAWTAALLFGCDRPYSESPNRNHEEPVAVVEIDLSDDGDSNRIQEPDTTLPSDTLESGQEEAQVKTKSGRVTAKDS